MFYNSWHAWLAAIPASPNGKSSETEGGRDWCSQSYRQARKEAESGSPELGRSLIPPATAAATAATAPVRKRQRIYAVAGGAPNVPRWLGGDPVCMMQTTRRRTPAAVRVLYPIFTAAAIPDWAIVNHGRAVLEIVDALETNGTRVEILGYLVAQQRTSERDQRLLVTFKSAQSHYDRDLLATAMLSPATFRRLAFRWIEDHWPKTADAGYANHYQQEEEMAPEPDTWHITPVWHKDRYQTMDRARATVRAAAEAAGIAL